MRPSATLWLVRHAVTVAEPGLCYGRLDLAADPAATQLAATALAVALPAAATVRCSPAQRCRQLATAVAALRPDLPAAQIDDRLLEMDFGAWEGRSWDSIGEPAMRSWTDDFSNYAPGGGESVRSLLARVANALDEQHEAERSAVWITHAGVVRATRLLAAGVRDIRTAADWPHGEVPFGGWETLAPVRPELSGPAAAPASPA